VIVAGFVAKSKTAPYSGSRNYFRGTIAEVEGVNGVSCVALAALGIYIVVQ